MKRSSRGGDPHKAVQGAETLLGTAKPVSPRSWSHCCGRKETEDQGCQVRDQGEQSQVTLCFANSGRPDLGALLTGVLASQGSSNLPVFEELMAVIVSCSQQMKGREQAPLAL